MNNPIETKAPAKNMLPMYWETTAPQSRFPAFIIDMGIPSVNSIAIETKINPERNLVNRTTHPLMGWVNNVSNVPSLCSSDNSLMVAAGMNRVISQGNEGLSIANSTVNKGRKDASPIKRAVLKYAHDNIDTNTTISM